MGYILKINYIIIKSLDKMKIIFLTLLIINLKEKENTLLLIIIIIRKMEFQLQNKGQISGP